MRYFNQILLVLLALLTPAYGESSWVRPDSNKMFWAQQGIQWASLAADAEVTHEGIGRGKCVEGNSDLARHPSRSSLYLSGLPAAAFITGVGALIHYTHTPGERWIHLGAASYVTEVHLHGAFSWLGRCW